MLVSFGLKKNLELVLSHGFVFKSLIHLPCGFQKFDIPAFRTAIGLRSNLTCVKVHQTEISKSFQEILLEIGLGTIKFVNSMCRGKNHSATKSSANVCNPRCSSYESDVRTNCLNLRKNSKQQSRINATPKGKLNAVQSQI